MSHDGNHDRHQDGAQNGVADAVVVGGGIVGICVALHLQATGRQVVVVERQHPGDGASGHNAGSFSVGDCLPVGTPGVIRAVPHMLWDPLSPLAIRWRYLPRLAPWLVRFALASRHRRVEAISVALQSLMAAAMDAYEPLIANTEAARHLRPGGILYTYCDADAQRSAQYGWDVRGRRGATFRLVDEADIEELDPVLAGRFSHGAYLPDAWFTPDPRGFTAALADELLRRGGELHQATAVGFETSGSRVAAVRTTAGALQAETVVIAAGAWSRRLVRQLDMDVPLDTERGYGVALPDPGFTLRRPVVSGDHHLALRPAREGLVLAGTAELAGLSAPPNWARSDKLVRVAKLLFPELRTDGAEPWMSFRPSMPDSLPVIGPVPSHLNAYLAFGHGHKGLAQAAITGRLVQELLDGDPPTIDPEPFRPTRFSIRRSRCR
jgi:D-amino-acid dehydrogenase